jgi:hypothetical protein
LDIDTLMFFDKMPQALPFYEAFVKQRIEEAMEPYPEGDFNDWQTAVPWTNAYPALFL